MAATQKTDPPPKYRITNRSDRRITLDLSTAKKGRKGIVVKYVRLGSTIEVKTKVQPPESLSTIVTAAELARLKKTAAEDIKAGRLLVEAA